jgi:hypothetical protein
MKMQPIPQRTMTVVPQDLPVQRSTLDAMIHAAIAQKATIADMKELYALKKEWEADEARKAYVAAMAAFKLHPPEILKKTLVSYKTNSGVTEYMHADLGEVCQQIVGSLAQHGFSHAWQPKEDGKTIEVSCILTHAQGHSESVTLRGPSDTSGGKNAIQADASTRTYLQRYSLLSITGLATKGMDNDGRGDTEDHEEETHESQAARRKEEHDEAFTRHSESVAFIKDRIASDDFPAVASEWASIPQVDQMALWLATSKGGCFTTLERATIKEKLPSKERHSEH